LSLLKRESKIFFLTAIATNETLKPKEKRRITSNDTGTQTNATTDAEAERRAQLAPILRLELR